MVLGEANSGAERVGPVEIPTLWNFVYCNLYLVGFLFLFLSFASD